MTLLFIPERHEALRGGPWHEAVAREGIQRIVSATCEAFDAETLWPVHPRDREPGEPLMPLAALYNGAAGVIWALRRLERDGLTARGPDFTATIADLLIPNRRFNDAAGIAAFSYLLGDAGVLLLQWMQLRDPAAADALFMLAEGNLHNPTLESLWGSPGTMVAMIHMLESLPDPADRTRWQDLFQRGARILFEQMHRVQHSREPRAAAWVWTQAMSWGPRDYLGGGHGFAGNVYPILRGARWLDPALVEAFEARALETLEIAADREGDAVNWQPVFDPSVNGHPAKPLMQDCHGAPGIICRLGATRSIALGELLAKAAEAVWLAGPLVKPPGLCHGTDGNGYAFLRMHALTGEQRWLDRARAFAMHALQQSDVEASKQGVRRFSLWSGDLGLALFLSSCLRADPAFPTLDVF